MGRCQTIKNQGFVFLLCVNTNVHWSKWTQRKFWNRLFTDIWEPELSLFLLLPPLVLEDHSWVGDLSFWPQTYLDWHDSKNVASRGFDPHRSWSEQIRSQSFSGAVHTWALSGLMLMSGGIWSCCKFLLPHMEGVCCEGVVYWAAYVTCEPDLTEEPNSCLDFFTFGRWNSWF